MHDTRLTDARGIVLATLTSGLLATSALPARAYDVSDRLSLNAVIAAAGQCQEGSGESELEDGEMGRFDDTCRGGLPIQAELSFRPTESDELFAVIGYAVDNGLNEVSPFALAPWAADLEDDLKDINGRGRDYLLQAWYKHTFALGEDATLGATFGIIDSTSYLDENAYAGDEFTQFMNEAFVNSGGYSLPSYDAGAALELAFGDWEIKATALNIGENDDGDNYNFWGGQIGYRADTGLGEGTYRAVIAGTSKAFLQPEDDAGNQSKTGLLAYGLSFDQALGDYFGAFLRMTWTDHNDILDYRGLYTGGVQVGGGLWGREKDTIGIAYGYLEGADTCLTRTNVAEAYYRTALNDTVALTADIQHMSDDYDEADTIDGWIFGLRAVAEF
jgi:porin